MKIWEHPDFETDLTFLIWLRFEEVMAKLQTDKYFYGHGVLHYKDGQKWENVIFDKLGFLQIL